MRWWVLALIMGLVVVGALVIWRVLQQNAQAAAQARQRAASLNAPAPVEYAVARRRDIINTYQGTGTLASPQDVLLTPKVTGRILFLEVHEGDRVHTGQVLVRIDPTEIEAQVRQQRAALEESEHRLAQAQVIQHATNVAHPGAGAHAAGRGRERSGGLHAGAAKLRGADSGGASGGERRAGENRRRGGHHRQCEGRGDQRAGQHDECAGDV